MDQLNDEIVSLFGGRAAEELIFGKISTGAQSDLERVTKMMYSMVTIYGMNPKVGNVSFHDSQQSEYNMTKPYSDETARLIDEEVRTIIGDQYERTKELLSQHIHHLHALAGELLKKEVLYKDDLTRIIGPRPFAEETTPNESIPPVNSTVLDEPNGYGA
jgi:cell division protease FtsH